MDAPDEITIIAGDGQVRFIYSDALMDLMDEGDPEVRRASHVEPAKGGGWVADMSPVGGPMLGPFDTHAEAIRTERQWLREHDIPIPS